MKVTAQPHYHAYLLRLWRDDAAAAWHASAQNPHTGQIHHFATVEQMLQFLKETLAEPASPPTDSTDQSVV